MLDFENIELDCSKTWDLISDGNTKGVFQLESRLGQSMSKKLKPQNIEQLSALISILRPGCLEAIRDGKTVSNHYIDKKNGSESIDYFHDALEPILSSTYGEMVYQEQAMQICQKIAQFDLCEADMLRKAIGKKKPEEMAKIKTLFIEKSKLAGIVNDYESEQIFSWIEKSQRYSFNKSHAVSYAMNAYVSAYAKSHYPHEFFVSYLKFAKEKMDPTKEIAELVNNAISTGIKVCKPDIRKLNKEFILENKIIFFGLTNIKCVGDSVFNKLIDIIQTQNIDIGNLCLNETLFLVLDKINSAAAKAMISVGCFDHLKVSRKKILFLFDIIQNLSNREKDIILNNFDMQKDLIELLDGILNHVNKRRHSAILSLILATKKPAYNLEDQCDWIANVEKQYLGVSITCSLIDGKDIDVANTDCRQLSSTGILPKHILVGAQIDELNTVKTKKGANPGQEMAFLKISDGTGSSDLVIFPKEYSIYKSLLYKDNTVMFNIEHSKNKDSYIVKKCWQI